MMTLNPAAPSLMTSPSSLKRQSKQALLTASKADELSIQFGQSRRDFLSTSGRLGFFALLLPTWVRGAVTSQQLVRDDFGNPNNPVGEKVYFYKPGENYLSIAQAYLTSNPASAAQMGLNDPNKATTTQYVVADYVRDYSNEGFVNGKWQKWLNGHDMVVALSSDATEGILAKKLVNPLKNDTYPLQRGETIRDVAERIMVLNSSGMTKFGFSPNNLAHLDVLTNYLKSSFNAATQTIQVAVAIPQLNTDQTSGALANKIRQAETARNNRSQIKLSVQQQYALDEDESITALARRLMREEPGLMSNLDNLNINSAADVDVVTTYFQKNTDMRNHVVNISEVLAQMASDYQNHNLKAMIQFARLSPSVQQAQITAILNQILLGNTGNQYGVPLITNKEIQSPRFNQKTQSTERLGHTHWGDIENKTKLVLTENVELDADVYTAYRVLKQKAADAGVHLAINDAYRSPVYQFHSFFVEASRRFKSNPKTCLSLFNRSAAAAPPFYSEHTQGAIDLMDLDSPNEFKNTPSYPWLQKNANPLATIKYGPNTLNLAFKQSFTGQNGQVMNEPWHWMYTGQKND